MERPGHDIAEVIPIGRRRLVRNVQVPVPECDMDDAVRSFDRFERCAASLRSGRLRIADVDGTEWPIVAFQLQLPGIRRRLDRLAHINIATCPDTHWALRLTSARTAATARLGAVTQSLHRAPSPAGPLNYRLAADIKELIDALRQVRQLIVVEYPGGLRTS